MKFFLQTLDIYEGAPNNWAFLHPHIEMWGISRSFIPHNLLWGSPKTYFSELSMRCKNEYSNKSSEIKYTFANLNRPCTGDFKSSKRSKKIFTAPLLFARQRQEVFNPWRRNILGSWHTMCSYSNSFACHCQNNWKERRKFTRPEIIRFN